MQRVLNRQQDTSHSDLDLLIISPSLSYADLFGALESSTATLGRNSNPTRYPPADAAKRFQSNNAFVTRVWQQPKQYG